MIEDRCFLPVILVFAVHHLVGQNLVLNPGFEAPYPCPDSYNTKPVDEVVPGWFSRDTGTPDFYHRCSDGDVGVPENWASIAEPVSGDAYLGFYVFRGKYREILQAELTQPLIKDSTYLVGGWLNHGAASAHQVKILNVSLEKALVYFDVEWEPSRPIKYRRWKIKSPEERGWTKVELTYQARGGERFLIIGALDPKVQQTAISWEWNKAYLDEPQLDHAAYYFLDDVYVRSKYGEELNLQHTPAKPSLTLVLEDINFQFNRWDLNDSSRMVLGNWAEQIDPAMVDRMVVSGHTDDRGTTAYNQRLSRRRAEGVKNFLVQQGWPPELIEIQAFGESSPIVSNETPDNRSRNRRVVIEIFEVEQF